MKRTYCPVQARQKYLKDPTYGITAFRLDVFPTKTDLEFRCLALYSRIQHSGITGKRDNGIRRATTTCKGFRHATPESDPGSHEMTRIILIVPFLLAVGCSSWKAPSLQEHALFVRLVQERLAQDGGIIHSNAPFHVRIRNARATAAYAVEYEPLIQSAFNPYKTEFRKVDGTWAITSHKWTRPWWWHVANHTIGVKQDNNRSGTVLQRIVLRTV